MRKLTALLAAALIASSVTGCELLIDGFPWSNDTPNASVQPGQSAPEVTLPRVSEPPSGKPGPTPEVPPPIQ
jgi:hypothetical protein